MDGATRKTRALNLSTRLYRSLLGIYPAAFRQDYGDPMLQVFRDCVHRALRESGTAGLLSLWMRMLLDTVQTAIEEHAQRGVEMNREKFIKLSGWALTLAAVVLVLGFGIGGGESNYEDPLGGYDGLYEYGQLVLIPASLLLYTLGMIGLRIRYGEASGWLGKSGLTVAAAGGGLGFLSAIPLFALLDEIWVGEWWYLMIYSILGMLVGLSLFGIAAVRNKPMPRWNALPLLTAVWFPAGSIIRAINGGLGGFDNYMAMVSLLFMFVGSIVLGYTLQKDTPTEKPEAPLQA